MIVQKLPFKDKLKDAEKELLFNNAFKRNYKKNTENNAFSDACLGMIYVISGTIRVYIISDEGRIELKDMGALQKLAGQKSGKSM